MKFEILRLDCTYNFYLNFLFLFLYCIKHLLYLTNLYYLKNLLVWSENWDGTFHTLSFVIVLTNYSFKYSNIAINQCCNNNFSAKVSQDLSHRDNEIIFLWSTRMN